MARQRHRDEPSLPEFRWPVPFPRIVLLGCGMLVPDRPGVPPPGHPDRPFHAAPIAAAEAAPPECDRPRPKAKHQAEAPGCPVCKGSIGVRYEPAGTADLGGVRLPIRVRVELCPACADRAGDLLVYCGACDGTHPRNAGRLRKQADATTLQEAALAGKADAERREQAYRDKLASDLRKRRKLDLSAQLTEAERRAIWNGYARAGSWGDEPPVRVLVARRWLREIGQAPDFDLILDHRGRTVGRWSAGERPVDDGPTGPAGNEPDGEEARLELASV